MRDNSRDVLIGLQGRVYLEYNSRCVRGVSKASCLSVVENGCDIAWVLHRGLVIPHDTTGNTS